MSDIAKLNSEMREALSRILRVGNSPYGRTASELGVSGATMAALARRGFLIGGNIYGSRVRSYRFTERAEAVRQYLTENPHG